MDVSVCDRVKTRIEQLSEEIEKIEPTPFLDDTTTKNVNIDQDRLSGIVDVDHICFSDPPPSP